MIVTIVGAGRLAEGVAVRALSGGHRLRVVDSEPGKADTLAATLSARGTRNGPAEASLLSLSVASVGEAIAGADVVVLALPYPDQYAPRPPRPRQGPRRAMPRFPGDANHPIVPPGSGAGDSMGGCES